MLTWDLHIASTLGLLLGLSLFAGLLAELLHLPKVTAYLGVGLLLGPSLFNVIPTDHVHAFDPMLKLAIALVLFNLGCHFSFNSLRVIAGRALILSAGELTLTFLLVTCGVLLFGQSLGVSVLLGCLALATAPATTILVIKEFRSAGPITELTGVLLALNNFAAIVTFEVAFLVVQFLSADGDVSLPGQISRLLQDILGSLLYGLVTGLLLSYLCGLIPAQRWPVLLLAAMTFLLGVCESAHLPFMLTFLVVGVTVANTSSFAEKIVDSLDSFTGLLCVIFFAVHGAELDLQAFLHVGGIGVVYIVCRSLGKYLGIYGAARLTKQPSEVRRFVGVSMLAQAGAAIALSTIAVHRDPQLGAQIQPIILGTVVVFELIGPILIRYALLRGGEIPISHAIHHTSQTPLDALRELADRLLVAIGWRSIGATPPEEITVRDLLRHDAPGIHQSASFSEVVKQLEHRHENTFPVVNDQGSVVGLIRYTLLSHVMFDKAVSGLVRAEDLASPVTRVLYMDETAQDAFQVFRQVADDCIPVVARDEPHALLGIVHRSDVMHTLIRQQQKPE